MKSLPILTHRDVESMTHVADRLDMINVYVLDPVGESNPEAMELRSRRRLSYLCKAASALLRSLIDVLGPETKP
jgi:hypothetical protein